MELKYPKKIKILSYMFVIKYDKNEWGGSVDFTKREIMIGTASLAVGDYLIIK